MAVCGKSPLLARVVIITSESLRYRVGGRLGLLWVVMVVVVETVKSMSGPRRRGRAAREKEHPIANMRTNLCSH